MRGPHLAFTFNNLIAITLRFAGPSRHVVGRHRIALSRSAEHCSHCRASPGGGHARYIRVYSVTVLYCTPCLKGAFHLIPRYILHDGFRALSTRYCTVCLFAQGNAAVLSYKANFCYSTMPSDMVIQVKCQAGRLNVEVRLACALPLTATVSK